jgi:hypothetical protein
MVTAATRSYALRTRDAPIPDWQLDERASLLAHLALGGGHQRAREDRDVLVHL